MRVWLLDVMVDEKWFFYECCWVGCVIVGFMCIFDIGN